MEPCLQRQEQTKSACVCPDLLCRDHTPLCMCIVSLFATPPSHAASVSLSCPTATAESVPPSVELVKYLVTR